MGIDRYAEYAEAQQALVLERKNALLFLQQELASKGHQNDEEREIVRNNVATHKARCDLLKDDSFERYARWEKAAADRQERFQNRMSIVLAVVGVLATIATLAQVYFSYLAYELSQKPPTIQAAPPAPPASR